MKTTIEIKELNCNDYSDCNTPDEYNNKLYNFMNKKWYSEEEIRENIKQQIDLLFRLIEKKEILIKTSHKYISELLIRNMVGDDDELYDYYFENGDEE